MATPKRTTQTPAEKFFYANAPYSYGQGETREQGRRRVARSLAHAEEHAARMDWAFCWEADDMPWDGDAGDTPREVLVCLVKNVRGEVLSSLCGIGDPSPDYSRVIEAELALDALHLIRNEVLAAI